MLQLENAPLYERVQGQLGRQIEEEYSHGDRFPAERELMAQMGVSQPTIRRALQELVQAGKLRRHVGRGTFVQKYGRSLTTGIVVPLHPSPLIAQDLNGYAKAAQRFGCGLRVHYLHEGESVQAVMARVSASPELERFVLQVLSPEQAWALYEGLDERGFHTLSTIPSEKGYPGNHLFVDPKAMVRLCLDHLTGLGHRHIAVLANEPEELGTIRTRTGLLREEALRQNVKLGWVNCRTPNWSNSFDSALDHMPEVMALRPRPTAVVPISGVGAWAALRYAATHGLRVPDDFSVVAFDDLPCNDLVYPGLTTIKTDYALAAERALEILWSDGTTAIRETIQPTIDIRESTAPPTSRRRKPLP